MLNFLKTKRALTIIALIISSLIIWFLGDAISIYNRVLLESPSRRLTVIFLLWFFILMWSVAHLLWVKIIEQKIAQKITTNTADFVTEDQKQIQDIFINAVKALHNSHKIKHGRWSIAGGLYDLPWYAIIGPPGSGKTTTLVNSNLSFPLADKFGRQGLRGVGGTRLCDWWFTEEAVLIDTAGRFTSQTSDKERDQAAWLGFLQSLKKYRASQPLNGVIVVLSVADLLNDNLMTQTIDNLKLRINEIYSGLSHLVPIYLVINKMDLIDGFSDFFSLLDQDARNQVWGVTLPTNNTDFSQIDILINKQLSDLHQRLVQLRVSKIEQEKNIESRAKILLFPEQYRLILKAINKVCVSIVGEKSSNNRPFFRGVYFTSATQFGTPIDKVLSNMGLSQTPHASRPSSTGKSYFINDLLKQVIFSEAGLVTQSVLLKKRQKLRLLGLCAIPIAILVLILSSWTIGYVQSKHRLNELQQYYNALMAQKAQLHDGDLLKLSEYLGELNALSQFAYQSKAQLPLSGGGLSGLSDYSDEVNYVYQNALRAAFAQLLYREIESKLRQETDNKYQLLKAYLALAHQHHLDEVSLSNMLVDRVIEPKVGVLDMTQRKYLVNNLIALLKARPLITQEQIDQDLVKSVRESLKGRGLADVTYSVLQHRVHGKIKDFVVTDVVGASSVLAFSVGQNKNFSVLIPAFFTKAAYQMIMEKELDAALASLDEERLWVLGEKLVANVDAATLQDLKKQVLSRYFTEYVAVWSRFAQSITLARTTNLTDILQKIRLLTGTEDLLRKLATAIVVETSLTKNITKEERIHQVIQEFSSSLGQSSDINGLANIIVEKPFEPLAALFYSPEQKVELDGLLALLKEIEAHLYALDEASKRGQASPDSGGLQAKVRAFADRMPPPVSNILQSFYVSIGGVSQGAVKQGLANSLREVTAECNKVIAGRYPFVKGSTKDVEFADFGRVFSATGILPSFFDKNLKAMVDTSRETWQPLNNTESSRVINPAELINFQRADIIRQSFFQNSGIQPYFAFDLKWLSIPPSLLLEQAKFEADGQTHYLEADRPQRINWPALPGGNYVRITASSESKNGLSFQGPWAILRFLDAGKPSYQDNGRVIKLKWQLSDGVLAAEIRPASMYHPFIPSVLGSFNCPQNI